MVKFQSLILILIILISFLTTGHSEKKNSSEKRQILTADVDGISGAAPSFAASAVSVIYDNDKPNNELNDVNEQEAADLKSDLNKDEAEVIEKQESKNRPAIEQGSDNTVESSVKESYEESQRLNPTPADPPQTQKQTIEKTQYQTQTQPQPAITAEIALVKYLDSDVNIFELNAYKYWPIASLTKLMTAVAFIENGDLNKKITINENILRTEGRSGNFKTGETFRAEDLIKAMLVVSSNDAAIALAGENIRGFSLVDLMNQKAKDLNMNETSFDEPSGLSFLNQSTVNNLAKLVNYIYRRHPWILEITRKKEIAISDLNSGLKKKYVNVNRFAGSPDFIGGKTGYIEAADGNLISLFNKNERPVLIIVLGSKDRFGDTKELLKLLTIDNDH